MGRTLFLSLITLAAGFCLGLLFCFGFLEPDTARPTSSFLPSVSAVESGNSTAPASASDTPALDTGDNALLLESANQVAAALRDKDYKTLASFIHPVDGVLFTPYSTVEPSVNLRFSAAQIAALTENTTKYVWGISDGKGDPLEMTMKEYFARYVYNADYASAPVLGIDRVLGSGNALENVSEVFPGARFVEYYFPGINPQYNGFDWCGLKLVFSVYREQYKLIAVIHSEWTT